jgi:hypothetical protein
MGKCSVHRNIPLSPRCARTLPFGRAGRRGPDGARRRADAARRSASRIHRGAPVWDAMRTRSLHSASLALGSGHAASILCARQSAPGADVRPQSISKSRKSVQPLRNGLNAALAARTGLSNSSVARLRCRFTGCCIRSPRSRLASPMRSQNSQRLLRKATGPCHRGEIAYSTEERFP